MLILFLFNFHSIYDSKVVQAFHSIFINLLIENL